MTNRIDQRELIISALRGLERGSIKDAASLFFATLGYASSRHLPISTIQDFCSQLDPQGKLTERDQDALRPLQSLHFLFQFTNGELSRQGDLIDDPSAPNTTKIESYLFFVAELPPGQYSRTTLATIVRAINKPLPMPALLLLRHGDSVSLGIIHRRLNRRDQARDVLEKVTLIKDIACADPIRAHIEILNDFVLNNLDADFGVSSFVRLHEAWQKRLGSYALSNDFYREIADWYFWAQHQVEEGTIRLPLHCDTKQERSLFLIRLLTRVIFCWFLIEKRLIPSDLFREHRLKALLKEFHPCSDARKPDSAPTYYRAILQNLFFGTLNMPTEQRAFRKKKKLGERYDQNYGITNLWRYETAFHNPSDWLGLAQRVPFLNGGLFDCLDDKSGKKKDNFILDGFSDREDLGCHLPNDLFFGPERVVDLSRDYGEETKKSARSKKARVRGLVEILSGYKFTIEENTPLEEEIALDPELLGKVFENLLASYNEDTGKIARKALGAFYTPREIVSYMVDESLKSYLAKQVPRCKGALEDLFSKKATMKEIRPDTREALIAAIARVKILDPACGSGAFPMGALHRLVDLLQKLDPDNTGWREIQRRRALEETERNLESGDGDGELREKRLKELSDTFDLNSFDYGRKLYLIENCIYGVDIQPIATQIAKLRFFVILVVDQRVDPAAPNLGVRPLPNLETRLVSADTLVPLEENNDYLFLGELDKLRTELADTRHRHFNARNQAEKRRWQEADSAKRIQIANLLKNDCNLADSTAGKLASWDPYDQNSSAPFFDPQWMFGLPVGTTRISETSESHTSEAQPCTDNTPGKKVPSFSVAETADSGFDIVIGNPPYGANLDAKQKDVLKFKYDHIVQRIRNTYLYFLGAGFNFLKEDGVLVYIIPNEFLFQIYMTKARNYFLSHGQYLLVVNIGEDAFKAVVPTCIIAIQKSIALEYEIPVADLRSYKLEEFSERLITRTFPKLSSKAIGMTPNSIFSFDAQKTVLVNRLSSDFGKFEEYCSDIANGISTSCDSVYIVSAELAVREQFEDAYIEPCLRGGQFSRFWCPIDTGDRLLYVAGDFQENDCPQILKYLSNFRDMLVRKSVEKNAGKREWHVLFRARYRELFLSPKIIIRQTGDRIVAAIDRDVGYYCIDSVNVASIKPSYYDRMDYLLGALNSSIVNFYYREISQEAGRVLAQVKPLRLRALPIPVASERQRSTCSSIVLVIVNTIAELKRQPELESDRDPIMLAYWEYLLNGLFYELYFPAEVHGMGLRLFDLVEQSRIKGIDECEEGYRLKALRLKFEELYDIEHPLRAALFSLGNLDIVRIIEGRE